MPTQIHWRNSSLHCVPRSHRSAQDNTSTFLRGFKRYCPIVPVKEQDSTVQ